MNSVQDMPGIQAPIGFFDPVGYSTTVSPEAMLWFRAAELKVSPRVRTPSLAPPPAAPPPAAGTAPARSTSHRAANITQTHPRTSQHSRVAMLAFVGWCVNGAGWHFPGQLSSSVKFEDLAVMTPLRARPPARPPWRRWKPRGGAAVDG